MTPSRSKIHAPLVGLLLLSLAACGPKRPPPDLLSSAQDKLRSARAQGAPTYAPLELRFAEERLDQARAAMAERDYKAAAELAEESAVNSELAAIKSKAGKLRESIDGLRQQNAEIARSLPDAATGVEGGR
jgi:hypothetical protein